MAVVDLRAGELDVRLPPAGAVTIRVQADGDLSEYNLALWVQPLELTEPDVTAAVIVAARDDEEAVDGICVFTFSDVTPLDAGEYYRIVLAAGDNAWTTGVTSRSMTPTERQIIDVAVTLGAAEVALELVVGPGGGGGNSIGEIDGGSASSVYLAPGQLIDGGPA